MPLCPLYFLCPLLFLKKRGIQEKGGQQEKGDIAHIESHPASQYHSLHLSICACPLYFFLIDENLRRVYPPAVGAFPGVLPGPLHRIAQIVASKVRLTLRVLVQEQFTARRQLDSGNPNIENLKKDFSRFGLTLAMANHDPANHVGLADLKDLNEWRNIAAHHGVMPAAGLPTLATIQGWRNSCNGLATSLDDIMYNHLRRILRRSPWIP